MHSLKAGCSPRHQNKDMHARFFGRHEGLPSGNSARGRRNRLHSTFRDVQTHRHAVLKELSPSEMMEVQGTASFRATSLIELRNRLTPDISEAASDLLATDPGDLDSALPFLIELLESDNERVILLALEVVRDLASTSTLQLKLAVEGAAEAIAALLTPRAKYDLFWLQTISPAACEALRALCEEQPTIKSVVAQSGAVPQLVELANIYQTFFKSPRNLDKGRRLEPAGLAAARVLCSLAEEKSCKSIMEEEGVMRVMGRMLDEDANPPEAHKIAAYTMAKISVGV